MIYLLQWLLFGVIGFILWSVRRFRCKRYDDVFDPESDFYGDDGGFSYFAALFLLYFVDHFQ